MIKELEEEFIGTGEVTGFKFKKIASTDTRYLYEVSEEDATPHYEVFDRKLVPICIDFENRIYSETEFKEVYPKSKDFGIRAWTFRDLEKAYTKLNNL
jgi:hypothetical protein